MPKRTYDYEPGDILRANAEYRVVRRLGAGGMGAVYGVEHRELNRRFALKTLPLALAHREDLKEMFGREARTLAQLAVPEPHPGIVEVVDLGRTKDRGVPYMVMPWLIGETLRSALDREHKLPILESIGITTRLFEALWHAHERGVVHRDVKTDNVFVPQVARGVAIQVLDFGISKLVAQADDPSVFIGTPPWASKEQLLGEAIGPASDIYSAAVVLFRCLTGRMPFEPYGNSLRELVAAVSIPAPPIGNFGDFPRELASLVARLLSKDPARRAPDALAVAEELQEIARHIRGRRDPNSHVTDRAQLPLRDRSSKPEPITEAELAPGTIEDPSIPRRVEEERRRWAVNNEERHILSPPRPWSEAVSVITGFERTEEGRGSRNATSPMHVGLGRTRSGADQAAAIALRAMREAPTKLPGPASAPLGPASSIPYVDAAPPGPLPTKAARDNRTVPCGPPRMTEPMAPRRRVHVETPGPVSASVAPADGGLLPRAARWRRFFRSTSWVKLGRTMLLACASMMAGIVLFMRVGRPWLDQRSASVAVRVGSAEVTTDESLNAPAPQSYPSAPPPTSSDVPPTALVPGSPPPSASTSPPPAARVPREPTSKRSSHRKPIDP